MTPRVRLPRRPRSPALVEARWLTPRDPAAEPRYLAPRNDAVFKMLLTEPEQYGFLLFVLNTVLRAHAPIRSAVVLNPELSKRRALQKGAVVDVLVALEDGAQVNVEMQNAKTLDFRSRASFYLARTHGGRAGRGAKHAERRLTVVIAFLGYREFDDDLVHHSVQLRVEQTGEMFTDVMRVELFELEKGRAHEGVEKSAEEELSRDEQLLLRFLNASSEQELEALATERVIMSAAAKNLKGYSTRVDAQLFADLAQLKRESDKRERVLQRAEGHAEGLEQGLERGLEQGLADGREQGIEQGLEQGRVLGLKVAAAKLLAAGMGRDAVERVLDVKLDSLGV
jgi:predicted transposase/invertase (TIGR01784 family)